MSCARDLHKYLYLFTNKLLSHKQTLKIQKYLNFHINMIVSIWGYSKIVKIAEIYKKSNMRKGVERTYMNLS